ncbi:MAG: OmpA family protein [Caulobacteraceae bacterium]
MAATKTKRWGLCLALVAAALASGCQTVKPRSAAIIAPRPSCADFTVNIYFDNRSAELTREARAVIKAAVARASGCRVAAIDVFGLADASGTPGANLNLSDRRAGEVTHALARRGFPPIDFRVMALGSAGAQESNGTDRPLRRRVDVVFHLLGAA